MTKPPKATPNSDIDGIHEDEDKIKEAADDGHSSAQLKRAADENVARPDYSTERSRDDRSR